MSKVEKNTKILLVFLVVVAVLGLWIWAAFSPTVYDYRLIYNHDMDNGDPKGALLFAFTTALRINHPAAYDMIDPELKPRLDEWMGAHQIQKCKSIPHVTLIWPATKYGEKVEIVCYGRDEIIDFVVDDILIMDMKVTDWGEVREED